MTLDAFLRILRDRLEELDVDEETIKRLLVREQATVSGLDEKDMEPLFTEERLSVLVASAKKRSQKTMRDKQLNPNKDIDEKSTVVPQVSHKDIMIETKIPESGTIVKPTDSAQESKLPKPLLENGTATVVISTHYPKLKPVEPDEEKTVIPTVKPSAAFHKLLAQNDTVRISDKATAEFLTVTTVIDGDGTIITPRPLSKERHTFDDGDEKTVLALDEDHSDGDTIHTIPIPQAPTADETDAVLRYLDQAHKEAKKKQTEEAKVSPDMNSQLLQVKESDLVNTSPFLTSLFLAMILLPWCFAASCVFLTVFMTLLTILTVLMVLPIVIYTALLAITGGMMLYAGSYSVSCLLGSSYDDLYKALILFAVSLTSLVLIILFLHRLIIPIYRFFKGKTALFLSYSSRILKRIVKALKRLIISV